jgi:hypothetical protein
MGAPAASGPWLYLTPMIALTVMILRSTRERQLKIERLWIPPAVILALTAVTFASQPPPDLAMLALDAAALGLGALGGWWRGRLTRITVDPATHELTSKNSAVGMLLILGVFAARYALRSYGAETAGLLHVSVLAVTEALMLLAVGLVCAQRLEIALRATRLLNDARASKG